MILFCCKIFADDCDIPISELYHFQLEQDLRDYNSVDRCEHCETPLQEDGTCREERCFSHDFFTDGERREPALC